MRCDVLAIGTELLLGQIVDTNSAWIGEQLAEAGIDTYDHRKVGDNLPRMVRALRDLVEHADAVIVCGGIGPTPDDVTREMIAEVMGVELERREELIDDIKRIFGARAREMTENNLRQADIPVGADAISNPIGTAPGIRAAFQLPDGRERVVYAVPGVPYEMQQMVTDHVIPDLLARSGETAVIRSRSLKTWGTSESGLAEMIAHRVDVQSNPTIAFLARGIEGLYVRMTAKAPTEDEAKALLDAEDKELRAVLGEMVFGVDDETVESAVLDACRVLGADVGIGITGVAGPGEQDGQPPGTVFYALAVPGHDTEVVDAKLPFDRERIRQFSTITVLNLLRMRLASLP